MPISDSDLPEDGTALHLRTEHVVQALARSNPHAARGVLERTGRIITLVSKAVLNDADAIREASSVDPAALSVVLREITGKVVREDPSREPAEEPERVQGAGLGEVIGHDAGLARLKHHAIMEHLEDWAGPTWSADQVLAAEDVTVEILEEWRRSRAIVEFEDRDHRPTFPAEQFSGCRPIPGLAEVQAIVGDAPSAWLWLVEPGAGAVPSWLDLLRRGQVSDVLEAARQDFR